MVKKIEAYQSKNGKVHATEDEALKHEFEDMLNLASEGVTFPVGLTSALWENREIIRDFLDGLPKK
jgi:hypothetical protein